jgi:hypothetical protein
MALPMMAERDTAAVQAIASDPQCARCRTTFAGTAYEVRAENTTFLRCLRCALTYGPLVRRSAIIAIIVGTVLIAINQGNVIVGGEFPPSLYWKIPLTYAVPYCVATTGAILNARRHIDTEESHDSPS